MGAVIDQYIENLNYIDAPPSPKSLAQVHALLEAEVQALKSEHAVPSSAMSTLSIPSDSDRMTDVAPTPTVPKPDPTLHPRLPPPRPITFSPVVTATHEAIASAGSSATADPSWTLGGIDPTRYSDLPDTPSATAVARLYSTATYLDSRRSHLSLLGAPSAAGRTVSGTGGITYGQGGWLVGNAVLEQEVQRLEHELTGLNQRAAQIGQVEAERQGRVHGELAILEGEWRDGVGRLEGVLDALDGLAGSS